MYGYDNLVYSIYEAFNNIDYELTIENIASKIHDSWCKNYIFLRANEPYRRTDYKYMNPSQPLNDSNRNYCTTTSFNDLNDEEKTKILFQQKYYLNILIYKLL